MSQVKSVLVVVFAILLGILLYDGQLSKYIYRLYNIGFRTSGADTALENDQVDANHSAVAADVYGSFDEPHECTSETACKDAKKYLLSRRNGNLHFLQRVLCVSLSKANGVCWVTIHPKDPNRMLERGFYVHPAHFFFKDVARALPSDIQGHALVNLGDQAQVLKVAEEQLLLDLKTPLLVHTVHRSKDLSSVVLIPDFKFMGTSGFKKILKDVRAAHIPFEKRLGVVFWRGSTTGQTTADCDETHLTSCSATHPCMTIPRVVLSFLARNISNVNIKLTGKQYCCEGCEQFFRLADVWSDRVDEPNWCRYRGILDIDGNTSAWGLYWRLLSGSVILRVESEWMGPYMEHMRPWIHYVPVKQDLSDLQERAKLIATNNSTEIALLRRISENAAKHAQKFNYEAEVERIANELARIWMD